MPIHPGGEPTAHPSAAPAPDRDLILADAFRDLHGQRLHGFAIVVALGEPEAAEYAAGEALAAGAEQAAALGHPERAAAWLRARTLRTLQQGARRATAPDAVREGTLAALGVEPAVSEGLASLSLEARAALVASAIERFEPIDIEAILGARPAATRRVIADARDHYLRLLSDLTPEQPASSHDAPAGELATRIRKIAARAMTAGGEVT